MVYSAFKARHNSAINNIRSFCTEMFVLAKRVSKRTSVILKRCYEKDRRKLVSFQYVFTLSDLSSLFFKSNICLQV